MNNQQTRLLLCTKDMMRISGKSESTILRMRKAIRVEKRKKSRASITVQEFCVFTGLKEETVIALLDA